MIGLALAGDKGNSIVKDIYHEAVARYDELTEPYKTVIDISRPGLPDPEEVSKWSGEKLANTLKHDPDHPEFNSNFRQLLHCAYKVAGEMGTDFTEALKANAGIIGENVTMNLFDRHIAPLFLGK